MRCAAHFIPGPGGPLAAAAAARLGCDPLVGETALARVPSGTTPAECRQHVNQPGGHGLHASRRLRTAVTRKSA